MLLRTALSLVPVLSALSAFAADKPPASEPAKKPHVDVRMIAGAADVRPGAALRLAFEFKIEDDWHLYFRDPGETGKPIEVEFTPVAGLTFGELRFPTPVKKLESSGEFSHSYDGKLLLTVPVTVADTLAGDKVALKASVEWLICKTGGACIPGSAELTLTLPVKAKDAAPAPVDLGAFEEADELQPKPASTGKRVKVSSAVSKSAVRPGDEFTAALVLEVEKGWHIQSHTPAKGFIATEVIWDLSAKGLGKVKKQEGWNHRPTFPAAMNVDVKGLGKLSVYEGKVVVASRLRATDKLDVGKPLTLRGIVIYQACDDKNGSCEQPVELEFEIAVPTAAAGAAVTDTHADLFASSAAAAPAPGSEEAAAAGSGEALDFGKLGASTQVEDQPLWLIVLLGILGGVLLNVMPCVLPVLGIKIYSFVQQAGDDPSRVYKLGIVFSAGLIFVFEVLAALTALAGQVWGTQFGSPMFVMIMAVVVFTFALSLFGVWTMQLPGAVNELGAKQQGESYFAAFVKGMLTTVLATPCLGPGLGTVISWAVLQPPVVTFTVFSAVGLGMALPYIILTANPKLMRFMPKPGAWMETFERAMGFILLATVLFFLHLINGQLGGAGVMGALVVLLGVGFAVWLATHLYDPIEHGYGRMATAWGIGLAIAVGSYYFAFSRWWPTPALSLVPLAEGEGSQKKAEKGDHAGAHLKWERFTTAKLEEYLKQGKVVHIDFTADWCLNCQVLKATVLDTAASKKVVDELGAITMVADWTDTKSEYGREIGKILKALNGEGIPTQAIFSPADPNKPIVLRDMIGAETFHNALREAAAKTKKKAAEKKGAAARPAPGAENVPVAAAPLGDRSRLNWEPFTQAGVRRHLNEGRLVLVTFTANWMPSSAITASSVVDTPATRRVCDELDVATLLADWTDSRSEHGREIARALDTIPNAGIPTQAIYHPAEPDEPIILRDHISPDTLHAALRQAAVRSRLQP